MALPTVEEIRDALEGYNITPSVLSDDWIEDERDNTVVPFIEDAIGYSLITEETITAYHSGTGEGQLFLDRKNITSLTSIDLINNGDIDSGINTDSIELIPGKGILKAISGFPENSYSSVFPKGKNNIKVIYKCGGTIPSDLETAIKKLTCISILDNIEGRTGGGDLSVQGFSRNYGNTGRYHNVRMKLNAHAMRIIGRYTTSVVGS